ncbi:YncE family protein [Pedobacter mendelii]|uniref:YncE family protein n=1 Tax=Pedobacter mendelii TaxID=1908240 RepID=A0ABQ2BGM0_9SPHI|nr:YncE family protein [Pedobacter mendelii]GGI23760.1 hypothetical protein GCM10008119_09270 [Pedobacter mendelii]
MKKKILTMVFMLAAGLSVNAQKKMGLRLLATHIIGASGGWDYLTIDEKNNNLFVSHGSQVNVLNKSTGDSVGVIHNTPGVHGIAIVNALGKGYITNGKSATCTVFDLKNLTVRSQINVGENPDAIFYDDYSKKVFVFNGKSHDATVIDPQTDKVVATISLGGKPEAGVSDGKGKIYVNIEDINEIVCFNSKTFKITTRYKLTGGEEPSGLAIDRATSRLFTVCSNKVMLVLDAKTGKHIAKLPIGDGADGVVFDAATKLAYASNGEGTITVVREVSADKFVVEKTVKSEPGARTVVLDKLTHHLFLPTANFEKSAVEGQRPKMISGTFKVLEFGK